MRLLLTAVASGGQGSAGHPRSTQDVVVDCDNDATVADLARALGQRLGLDRPVAAVTAGAGAPGPWGGAPGAEAAPSPVRLALVPEPDDSVSAAEATSPAAPAPPAGPPPPLYLGTRVLDPDLLLARSPVRHGALVGIGGPVADPLVEPHGMVEVRLTSGPGAGLVARLSTGDHVVGTDPGASVPLPQVGLPPVCLTLRVHPDARVELVLDPEVRGVLQQPVWRQRPLPGPIVLDADAEITERRAGESTYSELPPGTRTLDPEVPMPLVHLDREEPLDGQTWEPGQALVVGPCLLALAVPTAPDASLSPSPQGATLDYNRPPRLLPAPRETEFTLPNEPRRPLGQQLPWAFVLMPLIAGVAMYLITKSPYSLIFIALTPLMAVATWLSSRGEERKRYRTDFAEYTARMRKVQGSALAGLGEERAARRRDHADPGEILITAIGPRARLWERRQSDPDWMVARFGTADQVSGVRVKSTSREEHEGDLAWTAPDVPVTVGLAESGVTGLAGPARRAVGRWVLAQLAVLHSPVDLDVTLLTTPDGEQDWHWARWLPHLRSDDGDPELAQVGVDDETTALRIAELLAELDHRLAESRQSSGAFGTGGAIAFPPRLVVLDGSRRLRLLPGMIPLLQQGPSVRIYFLCLDEDERLLPEECSAVVQAEEPLMRVRITERYVIEGVRPDLVSTAWAERVARAIAPVRDVSAEDAAAGIPAHSRLLDVMHLDPPSAAAVQERWATIGRTTTAVVGENAEGTFEIDLVRDGPHGLVAGTTGSGKSELLQTLIGSLAAQNRPDEMTFVLVDYKGGAAFKDCNRLPHTVGMVTDLDGHLTTRALESLGAELRRREHQLAGADAKDIEDYLAKRGPGDEPMPRLLIVIDEFAALVAELPDFVTGLVDIARRGRSLGVHLILATQRPAGVVSAEIKSNTNLRIALRVTDGTDSQDVIESQDAAAISKGTPGRAYARLGHSSLIAFQSSRVGGRPRVGGAGADVAVRDVEFRTLGVAPPKAESREADISVPTDLASLVVACQEASRSTGVVAPPSPWLPALEGVVTLDDLIESAPAAVPTAESLRLPLGMTDVPTEQRRDLAFLDLDGGQHLAVIGASRSGRSTVLRAVAGAIGRWTSPEDVHVYGVDCGNNALLPLVSLPHVGAVVTRDQTDRMDRLVARLRGLISDRQQLLAEGGFADVAEQRRSVPPERRLPYVVILFDRWEGFFQAYDALDGGRLVAAFQQILQEGSAVGVRVVMTGDRTLSLGRMSTLLDDKLMLRMTDPSDFSAIGMPVRRVPVSIPDGRAFRAEGLRETQVALLADDPAGTAQVAALQTIGREATDRWATVPRARRPFHVDVLPVRAGAAQAAALAAQESAEGLHVPPTSLPVAVGGDTLGLRHLDAVEHGPGVLVTGARRSGRSTALRQLATAALERSWQVAVVTPRVSPLRELSGRPGVLGPFDLTSDQSDAREQLMELVAPGAGHALVVVDDVELVGSDGWLADLLVELVEGMRDSGSMVVGAGTAQELQSQYRGPAAELKKSGSGLMLSPQTTADADLFGARINRSAVGLSMPPGGGYLVSSGQLERVQVIWPE